MADAFDLLHPKVQAWIFAQRWEALRPEQVRCIELVLSGAADILVAAGTASGKTEAAFLPLCSQLASEPPPSEGVRVLHVLPLKALANDQFGRIEAMCDGLGIPVHKWHGDVSAAAKRRLRERPGGILLITPESLEALFCRRPHELRRIFGALSRVVVDELHAFLGTERGVHLQSLLHRLEEKLGRIVPRIGLSATLGDLDLAKECLRPGERQAVRLVHGVAANDLRVRLEAVACVEPPLDADASPDAGGPVVVLAPRLARDTATGQHLVFANSRTDVEAYCDAVCELSRRRGEAPHHLAHHGNLAKHVREEAERRLKEGPSPTTVVATSTLELGIDVGEVECVTQVRAPGSVAATRQRAGRSGRRGGDARLRLLVPEPALTAESSLGDRLRCELVQAMAVVELLAEGFCESPRRGRLHLSTLLHQLLSLVAERGEVGVDEAFATLCARGPFRTVDRALFEALVEVMRERGLLARGREGRLRIDAAGEQLVSHHTFFAVFETPEEFAVLAEGRSLGRLPSNVRLASGDHLVFAGRRWRVAEVDVAGKAVHVLPAKGARAPTFTGGGAVIDDEIRRRMRRIYLGDDVSPWLAADGPALLSEGRDWFRRYGLHEGDLIAEGRSVRLFPWLGTVGMETLRRMLVVAGFSVDVHGAYLEVQEATEAAVRAALRAIAEGAHPDALALAAVVSNKAGNKYDPLLGDRLLTLDLARRELDVEAARRWAQSLLAGREGAARAA